MASAALVSKVKWVSNKVLVFSRKITPCYYPSSAALDTVDIQRGNFVLKRLYHQKIPTTLINSDYWSLILGSAELYSVFLPRTWLRILSPITYVHKGVRKKCLEHVGCVEADETFVPVSCSPLTHSLNCWARPGQAVCMYSLGCWVLGLLIERLHSVTASSDLPSPEGHLCLSLPLGCTLSYKNETVLRVHNQRPTLNWLWYRKEREPNIDRNGFVSHLQSFIFMDLWVKSGQCVCLCV